MVRLKPHRIDRKNNNTPILFDREIDDYAQAVLAEYKPGLLRKPGAVNFQHFLESYLGMRLDFMDLYSDDPERPILALTVFRTGKVKVFDEESESVKNINVPARTVIIDNAVMKSGKESLALFSGMHESGHITMQWHVYTGETFDGEIFDPDFDFDSQIDNAVCCRRENIESNMNTQKIRTAKEWREHHADYFAAAITMPNATFKPFVNGLLRENKYYKGAIRLGCDSDLDILAEEIIPDAINEVYGVSKRAARIKLRKTGFVLNNN
jgi:hypothetical protein